MNMRERIMDEELEKLLHNLAVYRTNPDTNLIEKAYHFAQSAHENQNRKDGMPFFNHPLQVAHIVVEMRLDEKTICAALLHDVIEDTQFPLDIIEKQFGKDVAFLVEGVTKLEKLQLTSEDRHDYVIENLRKMFVAMAKDVRVVLIKLADRLHNMETLSFLPRSEQERIAKETLDVYAPLAERLGMGEIKGKLEDLAFPYVYPKDYQWILSISRSRYKEVDRYLVKVKRILLHRLKDGGINAKIHTRAKHLYSLYKKLLLKDKNVDKIYDLVALRIIVETTTDCYATLGIVHKIWTPLPGRIKDYISLPKPNGYQSLHTTVFCLGGKVAEIQIRTRQMHEEAENGIAARWYYGEQKNKAGFLKEKEVKRLHVLPDSLSWVRDLSQWQKDIQDRGELLQTLKTDTLFKRIFVFTPKGDVKDLPEGATPVDFAYAVHTEIGNSCTGAKVNGKLVTLSAELRNGDIVEILLSKNKKQPKTDWLQFIKTAHAKSEIRATLKKTEAYR